MANDQVTQSPREMQFGYAQQTAYGTAEIDSVAVTEIDCEPFAVNRDIKMIEVAGSHGSREKHENNILNLDKACVPTFTVEAIVKKEELAFWLAAFFQSVVEGVATPYDKTYTLPTTQPDFEADAGYFFTWFVRDPVALKSTKVKDCILKSLAIKLVGGEPCKVTMEWVGLGLPTVNHTFSGTWTANGTTNLFYREDIDRVTMDFGAGAVNFRLMEAEINLGRDIVGVGQDGLGQNQVLHLANPNHTCTIKVVKDDDWETTKTNHAANMPVDFNLSWGNVAPGTDDGDFDIAMHGLIDGPGGEDTNYDEPMGGTVKAHLCRTDTDETITVIMADDVQRNF